MHIGTHYEVLAVYDTPQAFALAVADSGAALAAVVGCRPRTARGWRNGERDMPVEAMQVLLDSLGEGQRAAVVAGAVVVVREVEA